MYRHYTILYNGNNTHRVYIHTYCMFRVVWYMCAHTTHTHMHLGIIIGDRGPTHLQDGYLMLQGILMFVWKT